jgi:hypothetical protein
MPGDIERRNINSLDPNEAYAIQVRSIKNGEPSQWSRKFQFTTIDDAHSGGVNGGVITAPETTTLISWSVSATGFTGVWNAITIMLNGKPTVITHYDLELIDSISGQTKIFQFYTNSKPTVSITLPLSAMVAIFGNIPGVVSLRVRGVNTAGTMSDWSNQLSTSMGVPDPPTNALVLEATDALKISWTPPANKNYLYGYRIYTGNTAGFTPSPANRIYEGTATTFTYATATYSLQYFKIRSYSEYGTESTDLACQGTPKSPFTIDLAPPAVPTLSGSLSAAGAQRKAQMTWVFTETDTGNTDIAGFVIRWRKVGDTTYHSEYAAPSLRALDIDLPQPFADYEFAIQSYDKVGNYSAFSATTTLTGSVAGAPSAPTGVASTASLDRFRITWNANTEPDVVYGGLYNVDIATNSGFTTGLLSYSTGNTFLEVGGLTPNTTYFYRVRAVDVGGTAGAYSTTGSRLTPDYAPTKSDGAAPASSPTPTLIQGVGYLTALWTRVTNNDLVTYDVHLSTTTGFTPSPATLVTSTTATSTIIRSTPTPTALAYGTTYYVKIVARDVDGSAAASAQASSTIAQATNADVSDVSAGKLTAGSISAATITIASGGSLTTANGDVTITGTGITVGANSNISAAAMQAGTAFVDDLTIQSNFTINTGGVLKSANYSAGTAGWQLSNTSFDMRSGTIAAGTLVAGTITSGGIIIGTGGAITIDATGVIKSNNYSAGLTGWQISSTGIEMNDANSSIKASALKTGTLGAQTITIGSGGAIRSSDFNGTNLGYQLDSQGFVMYAGTIKGAAVYTNQLASLSTDPNSPLTPLAGQSQGPSFGINASGKAVFSGALIYGNTVLGSGTSNFIQSNNYSAGSAGWMIRGDGYAEFVSAQINGTAKVGGTLSSTSPGWSINGDGSASFTNANMIIGNVAAGSLWIVASGGNGQYRIYPAGQTPGVSSTFHFMRPNGNNLEIHGAFGGAVDITDAYNIANVGFVANVVYLGINTNIGNNLYVNNYTRIQGGMDVIGGSTFWNTLTVQNQFTVNGNGQFNSVGSTNGVQAGFVNTGELRGDPVHSWITGTTGERYVYVGNGGKISRGAATPSSIVYKKNVTDYSYTKEQILSLRPVHYELRNAEPQDEPRYSGFIAEEVAEAGLMDFVVHKRVDEEGNPIPNKVHGFDYMHFTAALLKVSQEQQVEIDDLRARLDAAGL